MTNHPNRARNPLVLRQPAPDQILAGRTGASLTQREAAELVDGTVRSWQAWEAGERRMPLGTWRLFLARLAYRQSGTVDGAAALAALLGQSKGSST